MEYSEAVAVVKYGLSLEQLCLGFAFAASASGEMNGSRHYDHGPHYADVETRIALYWNNAYCTL